MPVRLLTNLLDSRWKLCMRTELSGGYSLCLGEAAGHTPGAPAVAAFMPVVLDAANLQAPPYPGRGD
jgi:hypothetical protein